MAWNSVWTTAYWPLGNYTSAAVLENAQAAYDALTASGREDDRVFAKNAPSERFGETPSAGKTNA